jgi:hypothetical protein
MNDKSPGEITLFKKWTKKMSFFKNLKKVLKKDFGCITTYEGIFFAAKMRTFVIFPTLCSTTVFKLKIYIF